MPTLNWMGKEKVVMHHREVPFHFLKKEYTFNSTASENMIIHSDNLLALKALLPQYGGKIDCIYIDPPYNTGNTPDNGGWVYNDNVSDPHIKKWLGEVVGKEGEDFSRHDKWLCMMYPRLKLLYELLSPKGVIFISIDDNEQANLKLLMDEIFGRSNFVCQFVWQQKNEAKGIPPKNMCIVNHEYIISYSKTKEYSFIGEKRVIEDGFSNPDNDPRGPWKRQYLQRFGQGFKKRTIVNPANGMKFTFETPYTEEKMNNWIKEKIIIFPKNEDKYPARKEFFYEYDNPNKPIVTNLGLYSTKVYSERLKLIFDSEKVFNNSKPVDLIKKLLQISTSPNSIILDSFAGSGTTAHAVLELNKEDGGNRKFILVEMCDYAENITAERAKRMIKGYGEGTKHTEGTGGDFSFYSLGEALYDSEGLLNKNASFDDLKEYIWYTETSEPFKSDGKNHSKYYLGEHAGMKYYFIYEKDKSTSFDNDFIISINIPLENAVVYADRCLYSQDFLDQHNLIFKKIPRDIKRV